MYAPAVVWTTSKGLFVADTPQVLQPYASNALAVLRSQAPTDVPANTLSMVLRLGVKTPA